MSHTPPSWGPPTQQPYPQQPPQGPPGPAQNWGPPQPGWQQQPAPQPSTGSSKVGLFIVLGVLALVAAGGAFLFLTNNDDEGDQTTTSTTAFDPDEPYDRSDPSTVVTRFEQARFANDCETVVTMVVAPMMHHNNSTPMENCEDFAELNDDVLIAIEHSSVTETYNDGDYVVVSSVSEQTTARDEDGQLEEYTGTSVHDYILVRDGDSWLIAYQGNGIDLATNDLDDYMLIDPPVPSP